MSTRLAVSFILVGALAITVGGIQFWNNPAKESQPRPSMEPAVTPDQRGEEAVAVVEALRPIPEKESINPSDASPDPSTGITVVDGRVTLSVKNKSLGWILDAIARQTGIAFSVAREIENRQISLELRDVSIEQALRDLLTGLDAFFYFSSQGGSSPPSLRTVWVHPQDRGRALTPLENRTETIEKPTDVIEESIQSEGNPGSGDDATTDDYVEMARADDPAIRMQGLSALVDSGGADETAIRSSLEAALADRDANVRAYAVQALGSRGDAEGMELLWNALSDPDPAVRVMAVETVDPQGQGIKLLEIAASDADETVRSMARFRLEQISGQ